MSLSILSTVAAACASGHNGCQASNMCEQTGSKVAQCTAQLQCIQNNLGNALKQCMSNDNLSLLVRNVSLAPKVSNKRHAAVQSAILLFVTVNTAPEVHLNALQYSLA